MQLCILGIDGSGKSTIAAALPAVLASLGARAGSAGERFLAADAEEDLLAPGFHPEGLPLSARLAKRLKLLAKAKVNQRKIYPALKLAQMLFQDHAACRLAERYHTDVMVSDGNVLLSATGRAANYLRPASDQAKNAAAGPGPGDLLAVFDYVLEGRPISEDSQSRLPRLEKARRLYRLTRACGLRGVWLPDMAVFLDLSPGIALARIASRGAQVDRHENESDLSQAREMYLRTLEAFARARGPEAVVRIDLDELSPGEALGAIAEALGPRVAAARRERAPAKTPLGTTETKLAGGSVWSKVFNYRYLVRYLLRHWFDGAWREPMFPFSSLGRMFLKEGYSAGVMRAIYDQDEKRYGFFDRIFLEYPLHRAVYDRLQILTRFLEPEMDKRLEEGRPLRILTAPSGFAYDLFRPLEAIARHNPEAARRARIVAADLDPYGSVQGELAARAEKIGVGLEFLRGDITDDAVRGRMASSAPYDMVLFVGLSSWLPKPRVAAHLRWVRGHMRESGVLVTDCFTAAAYSLSGRYVGYKAHYYAADVYRAFLDYCGFDGLHAVCESGRDRVNHVLIFRPRLPRRDSVSPPAARSQLESANGR